MVVIISSSFIVLLVSATLAMRQYYQPAMNYKTESIIFRSTSVFLKYFMKKAFMEENNRSIVV